MKIKIQNPGLFTTVQDLGRWQGLSIAVPLSGAMDTVAARIANLALGNDQSSAVLEFTYGNAAFKSETDLLIAYAGMGAIMFSAGNNLPPRRPVFIPAGQIIKLVNHDAGTRTYLAIAGGWNVPVVLGSKSTYTLAILGGFEGRRLKKNDQLLANEIINEENAKLLDLLRGESIRYPTWEIPEKVSQKEENKVIKIFLGPEANWFERTSLQALVKQAFCIDHKSNRMGMHLTGIPMKKKSEKELLSTSVSAGTIQVTGNGNMIILAADCQTTGGYPRIAQVAAVDLSKCAQLKPGDNICFEWISTEQAEELYIKQETELAQLALAVKAKI